ncbi:MAG: hypothetical protein IID32_09055, partial [Planctomycetes bacterium]|nr:hypothetical protein [Planctomycetota bacterium]
MKMMKCLIMTVSALVLLQLMCQACAIAQIEINKGDHICFIGNGLADRMQHDGWLEAKMQAAYPDYELVIRNLGFSGDQVARRPRSKGFLDPHSYLTLCRADVVFAFFGYNESYGDDPQKFKDELGKFIDETRSKQYNGKSAARIVLISPIAHENLHDSNMPDGSANNKRLSAYIKAMAQIAKEKEVGFINLFRPSSTIYGKAKKPLTINGIHLTSSGNRQIGRVIVRALSGKKLSVGSVKLERIRKAVLDKNLHWFNRYRATDGNDVWGSRSSLKFVDKQSNFEVLQHELSMLDVMTANRDKRIWAAANGMKLKADDRNVPKAIDVKTNYKPSAKTGRLDFLSAEASIEMMKLPEGMKANLFASEEQFPELINPVQMAVDTKGRIWVAVWPSYPKWEPDKEMKDGLVILPDENRDGVADKIIRFATVHNPTGFVFWNGGVLVISAPDILFLKDTDGDDVADVRISVLQGLGSADTHHTANNLFYGPDGYIYYQRGIFNVSNVESPWETAQKSGESGMYRFNPRTFKFSFHAKNRPNPHGISFDYWGYHYATDGTGGKAYQVRPDGDGKFKMHTMLMKTVRPVAASGILSSAHFPEENNGNFIILNTISFLGIKQYTLEDKNGEIWGTETDDLLVSSDTNFRPSDFDIGDDGALYVLDWANPLIGHMQHHVRDPSRDHKHGRVYRITCEGRPLQKSVKIDGEPIVKLLKALEHPINGVRLRARMELSERNTERVIAATNQWVAKLDPKSTEDAHHLLEALWVHQQHNVVNRSLLGQLLQSPVPQARIAAQRVEYMWKIDGLLSANEKVVGQEAVVQGAGNGLTFTELVGNSASGSD